MAGKEYSLKITAQSTTPWVWRTATPNAQSGVLGSRQGTLLLPVFFVLSACAALAFDRQVSQFCIAADAPREIEQLLRIGETYCHGLGVLVIAIAIHQLDWARRRLIRHVVVVGWGAGLMANVIKLLVARVRPYSFDFQGDVWSTFTGIFPFLEGGSSAQSFPSAHVAAAAGLAVVLSRLYPQARWFFVGLAIVAACQRIQCGAHYVSDTLVGAAVGIVFARAILSTKWFAMPLSKSCRDTDSATCAVSPNSA